MVAPRRSARRCLDRLHVLVRKAEMVPDLVHQHVRDEVAKGFLVLGPVVQQRHAVEPDHVGELPGEAASRPPAPGPAP